MRYQRVETIGECVLYCGDAADLRAQIKGPFALLADPPYGIKFVHGTNDGKGPHNRYRTKFAGQGIIGDDRPFDPRPWLKIAQQAILWGANHYCDKLPPASCWLIWDKRATSQHSNDHADCEIAWSNLKGPARVFRHQWDGFAKASERGIERVHPTQKSIALMEWCLAKLRPDLTVVDPFMGSGTTGVACARMGRRFIGAEIDPIYFEHACSRIEAVYEQSDMFKQAAHPASCWEQFALFPESIQNEGDSDAEENATAAATDRHWRQAPALHPRCRGPRAQDHQGYFGARRHRPQCIKL